MKTVLIYKIQWDYEGADPALCELPGMVLVTDVPEFLKGDRLVETLGMALSEKFGFNFYGFEFKFINATFPYTDYADKVEPIDDDNADRGHNGQGN